MNVQLRAGNVNWEETNGKAERRRVKEPNGSKWKMQGTGTAEMQMVRRKLSEFIASRGWHWTETDSEVQPQPEANILMTRERLPG